MSKCKRIYLGYLHILMIKVPGSWQVMKIYLISTLFRLKSGLPKIVWRRVPGRDPPLLYFLIVIQIYDWYTFGKTLASTLIICNKKNCANSQNFKYLLQFQVIKQKMCKNKKCARYDKLYMFEPLPRRIQNYLQSF